MASRRFIGLVVSVLLLGALLLLFTDPWSTLRNNSKRIVLKDPDAIDRILIFDSYDSTSLIREDEQWLLFGREAANQAAVENLLFAAGRLQISSIVSDDPGSTELQGRSIQFLTGKKPVLTYQLLTQNDRYMILPSTAKQAFYVSVAGFSDLNLEKLFSSASNHYREHLLIDLLPSEISLIEVELPGKEPFRFLQDEEREIICYPAPEAALLPPDSLNELAVRLLFSYFTAIRYEEGSGKPVQNLSPPESAGQHIARLHVESFGGEEHTLKVYPYYPEADKEAHLFKALVGYNDHPEALVVNYICLDVLMRDLSHYFGEK